MLKTPGTPYWQRPDNRSGSRGCHRRQRFREGSACTASGSVAAPATSVALRDPQAGCGHRRRARIGGPNDLMPKTTDVSIGIPAGFSPNGATIELRSGSQVRRDHHAQQCRETVVSCRRVRFVVWEPACRRSLGRGADLLRPSGFHDREAKAQQVCALQIACKQASTTHIPPLLHALEFLLGQSLVAETNSRARLIIAVRQTIARCPAEPEIYVQRPRSAFQQRGSAPGETPAREVAGDVSCRSLLAGDFVGAQTCCALASRS